MRKPTLIGSFCLVISFITLHVFAASSNTQPYVITDIKKPIVVKRSRPTFFIALKSNPTTGYQWFLKKYNTNLIIPLKQAYRPPLLIEQAKAQHKPALVGAPGTEKWWFAVNKSALRAPGMTKVTFCSMRSWALECDQEKTFTVIWHQ